MRSELLHSKEIAKKRLLIEAQNTVSSMTLDQMAQIKKEIYYQGIWIYHQINTKSGLF